MSNVVAVIAFVVGDLLVFVGVIALAELQEGWPWGKTLSRGHRRTGWGLIIVGLLLYGVALALFQA